jgi:tRNA threonylcarbamoyl adenosine modification protein (Sua5/YciO/YrdC/YwlC family)
METTVISINPYAPEEEKIRQAGSVIRRGGLVAFPTGTVYGLGADAFSKTAISQVYKVKERDRKKPLSILISKKEDLHDLVTKIPESAKALMKKFWPGPLTLILPASNRLSKLLTANSGTVGVRISDNKIALALIRESGVPITSPSANISGHPNPGSQEDVLRELGGKIDLVIDGGPSDSKLPSTVVDLTGESLNILREGKISKTILEGAMDEKKTVLFVCTGNSCRSVIAEWLFKKMLGEVMEQHPSKRKILANIEVLSAGISPFPGMNSPPGTLKVMQEEGIDVSGRKAAPMTPELASKSSLILVMEERHKRETLNMAPECKDKIFLLKEFSGNREENLDIPDPIGHSLGVYKECTSEIKRGLKGLMEKILSSDIIL